MSAVGIVAERRLESSSRGCARTGDAHIGACPAHADGPVGLDRPSSPDEIRLICGGRFLDDGQQLKSELQCGVVLVWRVWVGVVVPHPQRAAYWRANDGCYILLSITMRQIFLPSFVGLSTSVGPPQPDLLVTIHVVIRPYSAEKSLQGMVAVWSGLFGC